MGRDFPKLDIAVVVCVVVCGIFVCGAAEQGGAAIPEGLEGIWDSSRYISVDEVRPGMEAYCLTVYKGAKVEKFNMEVLSVVRNVRPGRDAIMVQGTDERFIHSGPVAGCSGSPVYIDGRLAGAMAFGWTFSKDPLYGVTPVEYMLRVGNSPKRDKGTDLADGPGIAFDFSRPIDFSEVEEKISAALSSSRGNFVGVNLLPCPLVASGIPERAFLGFENQLGSLGFMVVSGGGGGGGSIDMRDVKLEPGAALVVPLTSGDISLEAIGTVTEVRGNQVYAFGHSLLGYGDIDLPMATGQVHTVVSNVMRSFKFGSSIDIVGSLNVDESAAVRGTIGAEARMIPFSINVRRDDGRADKYECTMAENRLLTPLLLRIAILSAALSWSDLPPDNMIEYSGAIGLEGAEPVVFENVSTGVGLNEMVLESIGPVAILMNNPYRRVRLKSFDFDVRVSEKDVSSTIWSVLLSDSQVKPGETLEVEVVTELFQAQKQKYKLSLDVPEDTPAGNYQLMVCGGYDYEMFLRKAVPHRFMTENFDSLIIAMNNILSIRRDGLYCILVLQPGGVALERAELPELPGTKALVLNDAKRAIMIQVFPSWIERSVRTGTIVVDRKIMNVIVEK